MEKQRIRFVFIAAILIAACLFTGSFTAVAQEQQEQEDLAKKAQPQQKVLPDQKVTPKTVGVAQFKIGAFAVIVETTPSAPAERQAAEPAARTQAPAPAVKGGTGYSGRGHIVLRAKRVPVTFSGIVVAVASPGQVPVASAGLVTGTVGPAVEYDLNGFKVRIDRASIRLNPERATAAAGVSLARPVFMAPGTSDGLTLASESCALFPSGAVAGKNFRGSSAFLLRDSIYRMRIEPNVDQSVQLGQPGGTSRQSNPAADGVILQGVAATSDNMDVFNGNGTIDGSGKSARFDLSLVRTPYQTVPEPGYQLTLQSGGVNYNYGADGKLVCAGEFKAQVALPEVIKGEGPGRIVLDGITLKTDQTGALFNALTVPTRFRAGFADVNQPGQAVFLIEPSPDSVFIYFAKWQAPQNSTYTIAVTDQKKGPDCKALVDFLTHARGSGSSARSAAPRNQAQRKSPIGSPAVQTASIGTPGTALIQNDKAREKNLYGRPGLTILQGTLHMKSPQATFVGDGAPPSGEFNLKTRVWGLVTATPWGLTGSLTSSGCSFIPDSAGHSLDECSAPSGTSQPAWEEILQSQERDPSGQPPHKLERFRLADLRVLEMRLTRLNLCLNAMPAKGATMTSIVHFPFPSYIDVDFVDESLDPQGFFHSALGPVAPIAQAPSASPSPVSGQDDPSVDPEGSSGIPHGPSIESFESASPRTGLQTRLGPMVKPKVPMEIPQTRILWAWRLPITLVGRGVAITFPQGRGPAAVQVLMSSTTGENGNIASSEIWLKPLFSKRSSVKQGVRVQAALAPSGEFKLIKWDTEPVLCRTYPSPGTVEGNELRMGFACRLDGITLADAGPAFNAESRDRDFGWTGRVTFPLFKDQPVAFGVKKLGPFMPQALSFEKSDCPYQTCPEDSRVLSISVRRLAFSPANSKFVGSDIKYRYPRSADNAEYAAATLEFSSFLTAVVLKNAAAKKPWLDLTEQLAPGQTLTVHGLKDYLDGKGFIDLACYDADALQLEGRLGMPIGCCRDNYFMGTYQVKQGEKIILSASNVRYYEGAAPVALYLGGTAMELTPEGDGGAGGNKEILDIPGAELRFENGALFGDFDTDSLPAFLPNIRGECAFTLDTRNAYFSVMIGGSFPITPFPVNVEGETFFFRAPRNQLAPILRRAAAWALYTDVESMKIALRMSDRGLSDSTVMSGVLLSGNAAAVADLGPVEARIQRGAGLFFYQYKNAGGQTGYNYGVFQNNRAVANVEFLTAEIVIDLTLAAQSTQGSFESVRNYFKNSDLAFTGTISAWACATCELAYASLYMKLDATYSVRGGLSWSGIAPSASVGLGGCR